RHAFFRKLIRAFLLFNGLRSRYCQRTLLVYHYPKGAIPCTAVLPGQLREFRTLRYLPELGKGLLLELPHTLTTDAKDVTNVLETMWLVCVETVAQPHNQGLAFGEVAEAGAHATVYLL